jgi:ABC-type multidrug transport system fused ATPase/permease subunit
MTSAARIDEYSLSHSSRSRFFYKEESANWPVERKIEFANYKLRYRPERKPVLKGINLKTEPRNKIAIIGRTSADKSSIFQALFRLIECLF